VLVLEVEERGNNEERPLGGALCIKRSFRLCAVLAFSLLIKSPYNVARLGHGGLDLASNTLVIIDCFNVAAMAMCPKLV